MKKALTALICLLAPLKLTYWLLNLLGHSVHRSARMGFSIVFTDHLSMGEKSGIGHFNLLRVPSLSLENHANVGALNLLNGPVHVVLRAFAAIGNSNRIGRPPQGVSYGKARLELGIWSKITASHYVDCTRSITFGDYTTLAGAGSQVWTHGYFHYPQGLDRFRVDGEIYIGHNVYIGSRSVLNAGIVIADGVVVGSNSAVSKSLLEPGMYVSQPLRHIPATSPDAIKEKYDRVRVPELIEEVYEKPIRRA